MQNKKNKKDKIVFFTKDEKQEIPTIGENRSKDAMVYAKFISKDKSEKHAVFVTEYEHKFKIGYGLVFMPEQIFKTLINFKEIKKNKNYERDFDFEPTLLSIIEQELGFKEINSSKVE